MMGRTKANHVCYSILHVVHLVIQLPAASGEGAAVYQLTLVADHSLEKVESVNHAHV